ncbi:hypothetical protein D3C87_143940 [compost metagenome]
MKKLLAIVALTVGFASVSQAGWMVEPYLGYEMGKIKDNAEGDQTATNLGVRVAYTLPVLVWLGLDGTYGLTGEYKPDAGSSADFNRKSLYGVVGVDLPILLRGWLGYSLMNEVDTGSPGTLKGSSFKIGLGFTALPFLSLNLEYINDKFDEFDGNSFSPEAKNEAYMFSVSLPFNF